MKFIQKYKKSAMIFFIITLCFINYNFVFAAENFNNNLIIKGDNQVLIPTVGESIVKYEAEANGTYGSIKKENIKFKLPYNIEGVEMSEDGLLKITTDVLPQIIKISAIENNNVSQSIEVELLKSWTFNIRAEDGTGLSIPNQTQVPQIDEGFIYTLFSDSSLINFLRTIAITILIGSIILFYWWKKKSINKTSEKG